MPSRRRRLLLVWALFTVVQAVRVGGEGLGRLLREPGSSVAPRRIDVDRAAFAELMLRPGIGPERAEAVVLERLRGGPFGGADGLIRVPGIGAQTVERLRPFITPSDAAAAAPQSRSP